MSKWVPNTSLKLVEHDLNPLKADATKQSNILKQFVGICQQIV